MRQKHLHELYLAGGCFWGTEGYFKKLPGIVDTEVGYANGHTEHPTYKEVCSGNTGFAETIRVRYYPEMISTETLLQEYFQTINPVSVNRQGNDRGTQYRTGIYYTDELDLPIIEAVVVAMQKQYSEKIATEILPLINFYKAEPYHQDYLGKNPGGYCHVNLAKAGELAKEKAYQTPDTDELKQILTDLQFRVTQDNVTEAPYQNLYNQSFKEGIYVDIVTGEPLFTSFDKFDSGCGWPSFSKPIMESVVKEKVDTSHHMVRREVRSSTGDSHLGHVFEDGPKEAGGLRYCINSASLEFIPYEQLKQEGYGYLNYLFKESL